MANPGIETSNTSITTGDVEIGAVELKDGSSDTRMDVETSGSDARSNTANLAGTAARTYGFNGTTWDRVRTQFSTFTNLGANATLNVKASAGSVRAIYCHNLSGATAYIQLHNTATTPSGGATPAFTFLVPAGGTTFVDGEFFGNNGVAFATGIAFAFSTTEITYTAGTAANQTTHIMYA